MENDHNKEVRRIVRDLVEITDHMLTGLQKFRKGLQELGKSFHTHGKATASQFKNFDRRIRLLEKKAA